MKENKNLEFAGDLMAEVQEAQKVCCPDNGIERGRTYTLQCTAFLTIFCC
ncbi:hypothetical protein [Sellimonas intestinalis]